MIRWSYLIPRLFILGLVALAIWIGRDPLIKSVAINSTQNVTGAKVDIDQIRTNLSNGKVFLKELLVADPRDPLRNLIQADMAYIKLDLQRLRHREIVIEDGKTSQILFGSPRAESGLIQSSLPQREPHSRELASQIPLKSLETKWQDSFSSLAVAPRGKLKTVALSEQIKNSWLSEMEKIRAELDGLKAQRAQASDSFKTGILVSKQGDPTNPLRRNEDLMRLASTETRNLHGRIKQMFVTLEQMERQSKEDIVSMIEAAQQDSIQIGSLKSETRFESESMSKLLLAELQHEHVEEIIDWFRWFRNSIPDPENDFRASAKRGQDIALTSNQRPKFLIKNLELEGEGHIAGQHLNFSGVARNLTTEPHLHDQPSSFVLRAQGNHQHMMVDCELDRRKSVWREKFKITCPGMNSAARGLGTEQTLVVSLSDNRVETQVEIETNGEQLSGTLSFRHTDALLHVDRMHPLAGGDETALRINQETSNVSEFSTLVTLSGTIDEPTYEFESDLGVEFADAMNELVGTRARNEILQLRQEVDVRTASEIRQLELQLNSYIKEVTDVINGEQAVFTAMNDQIERLANEGKIR